MTALPTSPECLTMIPREIAAVKDYEQFAKERLNANAWAYLTGGAADEITLHENEKIFESIRLKGRVLRSVAGGNTLVTLFGHTYAHPVLLAPVAYQRLFHPEGERASALGASIMEAGSVVSTLASIKWEDIVSSTAYPSWFQLYFQRNRADTLELVKRAEAAGFKVIVVTVDAPLAGIRNREHRAHFQVPSDISAINLKSSSPNEVMNAHKSIVFDHLMATSPTWNDIEWLVTATTLPVVVKGILDRDDALVAEKCGAAGIIVSNHGGRVIDTLPSTLEALPPIAEALGKRIPILLDGGIRRGSDIFKAIALGASAILIGRPYIYALAAAGALGVAHTLRILREELEVIMAVTGHATLQDIDENCLF
ncbi:MAG: alpha-hydroxy acid oxidase [Pseudomonadota bacterium]